MTESYECCLTYAHVYTHFSKIGFLKILLCATVVYIPAFLKTIHKSIIQVIYIIPLRIRHVGTCVYNELLCNDNLIPGSLVYIPLDWSIFNSPALSTSHVIWFFVCIISNCTWRDFVIFSFDRYFLVLLLFRLSYLVIFLRCS